MDGTYNNYQASSESVAQEQINCLRAKEKRVIRSNRLAANKQRQPTTTSQHSSDNQNRLSDLAGSPLGNGVGGSTTTTTAIETGECTCCCWRQHYNRQRFQLLLPSTRKSTTNDFRSTEHTIETEVANYNYGQCKNKLLPIEVITSTRLNEEIQMKEEGKEEVVTSNSNNNNKREQYHLNENNNNSHANLLLIDQLLTANTTTCIGLPETRLPGKSSETNNRLFCGRQQTEQHWHHLQASATKQKVNSLKTCQHLAKSVILLLLLIVCDYQHPFRIKQQNPFRQSVLSSSFLLSVDAAASAALALEVSPDLARVNLIDTSLDIQQFNKSIKEILATLKSDREQLTNNLHTSTIESSEEHHTTTTTTTKWPVESVLPALSSQQQDHNLSATNNNSVSDNGNRQSTTVVEEQEEHVSGSVDDDNDAACGSSLSNDEPTEAKNITDNEKLVKLQSCLQKQMRRHVKGLISATYDMSMEMPISGKCLASSMKTLNGLQELKAWAFKFVDASAKLPNGFMSGMLSDLGDYDQCLSIRTDKSVAPDQEEGSSDFSGKYCLISVKLNYRIVLKENQTVPDGIDEDGLLWEPLLRKYWTSKSNKGYQVGICLPSKCNNEDIEIIYNHTTQGTDIVGGILNCQDSLDVRRNQTADFLQKIIICLFIVLLVMVALGTIISIMYPCMETELFYPSSEEHWSLVISLARFFVAFSIIRNWKIFIGTTNLNGKEEDKEDNSRQRIFVTTSVRNDNQNDDNKILSHLSGIKLLVIGWIMIGHSFLYPSANNYQYYRAMAHMASIRDSIWFATTNFTLGIDTLLYMAGFLFVYKTISMGSKNTAKSSSLNQSITLVIATKNIVKIIWHKILRFWPTYLTIVGLAILSPLFGDGPLWPETVDKRLGQACRNNWWSNLLFINNYQDEQEICLPSSWFISILMQAFLVGSLVILVAQSYSITKALISLTILTLGTIVASFCHAYLIDIDAPVVRMDESFVMNIDGDIFTLYTRLYNNLGPFLIGMMGGFILISEQKRQKMLTNENDRANEDKEKDQYSTTTTSNNGTTMGRIIDNYWCRLLLTLVMALIAALALSSVFITNYSRLQSAIYWSFNRNGWALATGYLIHRCATNEWSLIRQLLSLSTFKPISKLIFVAYLIYPIYIHIHTGLVRDGLHISPYNMINIYITRLVFTFGSALIIHLIIEIPFCTLEGNFLNSCWRDNRKSVYSKANNKGGKNEAPWNFHPLLIDHPLFGLKKNDEEANVASQSTSSSSCSESSADNTSDDADEIGQLRVHVAS